MVEPKVHRANSAPLGVAELLDALRAEGERLAGAAGRAGLAAEVPTCPGWAVRDLLSHVGGVHRWAATVVREGRREPLILDRPQDIADPQPTDGELLDWFRAGHSDLVDTIAGAPEGWECWAFLRAATPVEFWARRQTHETTVHRIDAEAAANEPSAVAPDVAADGIDELVTKFATRRSSRLHAEPERALLLHATDLDVRWLVWIGADRPRADRVDGVDGAVPADTTVTGSAEWLYRTLWNRAPWSAVRVTGDKDTARLWSERVRIQWS